MHAILKKSNGLDGFIASTLDDATHLELIGLGIPGGTGKIVEIPPSFSLASAKPRRTTNGNILYYQIQDFDISLLELPSVR